MQIKYSSKLMRCFFTEHEVNRVNYIYMESFGLTNILYIKTKLANIVIGLNIYLTNVNYKKLEIKNTFFFKL